MSWSNSPRSIHAWERSKPTNAWTTDEVRRLRELAEQGVAVDDIAAKLRRSVSSIRNKAGMHGISLNGGRAAHERRGSASDAGAAPRRLSRAS